jgi:hypothetical protein
MPNELALHIVSNTLTQTPPPPKYPTYMNFFLS